MDSMSSLITTVLCSFCCLRDHLLDHSKCFVDACADLLLVLLHCKSITFSLLLEL